MLKAIISARQAMKNILEQTYEDSMTVYEMKKIKNPSTKITSMQETMELTDIPCKLSVQSADRANESDNVTTVSKIIKLYTSPEVQINAGSKITVRKATGESVNYTRSSEPVIYGTHAEYTVELFERYA